jgi:hypothetical protein
MCTWGISELPPEGLSSNPLDYYLTADETQNIDSYAAVSITGLADNETSDVGHAKMFGYTEGAVRAHYECGQDNTSPKCAYVDQTLQYTSAMAAFLIDDTLVDYIEDWHMTPGYPYHENPIGYGEQHSFSSVWNMKVAKCSDLPLTTYGGTAVLEQNMDEVVALWAELETLWSPEESEWVGCGYEGTANNVEAKAFGEGGRGCT